MSKMWCMESKTNQERYSKIRCSFYNYTLLFPLLIIMKFMKNLVARFNQLDREHPDWGLIPILRIAVEDTKPSWSMIRKVFNKYIPKDDYAQDEKAGILEGLKSVSRSK